jgi:hypothetical protein
MFASEWSPICQVADYPDTAFDTDEKLNGTAKKPRWKNINNVVLRRIYHLGSWVSSLVV